MFHQKLNNQLFEKKIEKNKAAANVKLAETQFKKAVENLTAIEAEIGVLDDLVQSQTDLTRTLKSK